MIERSTPVAVIGAGTMGAGIAQVAAVAGHPVMVYDAAYAGSRADRCCNCHEGEAMTLTWTKENSPRWDEDKQRTFGPAEQAAVGLAAPAPGDPVPDEWWRVTDGAEVAGYGWLDSEWGDARITFVVAPGQRGRGVGDFILEHLEQEAAARGLNYIYNIVPGTHPDGAWIRNWLSTHGFHEASRGQLRRQVVARQRAPQILTKPELLLVKVLSK